MWFFESMNKNLLVVFLGGYDEIKINFNELWMDGRRNFSFYLNDCWGISRCCDCVNDCRRWFEWYVSKIGSNFKRSW